jgi:hypothetical protein
MESRWQSDLVGEMAQCDQQTGIHILTEGYEGVLESDGVDLKRASQFRW